MKGKDDFMHHRIVSILSIICLVGLATAITPPSTQGQFATNTPINDAQSSDDAATAPANGLSFSTNTPDVPPTATATATSTATNTSTPTATATATNTPTNTPTPTPTPIGPFNYPQGVNPLTGLPYPNEEAMSRRNLIVKISNFPPIVRPQSGVNQADLVYEYEAEGGVTRFAAIYRSQAPERVGSVRSGRLLDIELVTMYRALLAYSGTSEPIQELFLSDDFFNFQLLSPSVGHNCDRNGFCRDDDLLSAGVPREHTLFADADLLWETATNQGTNTGYIAFGLAFGDEADPGGEAANDVYVEWWGQADARWQYQPETGRYVRYSDGVPHNDALDGEQLWADNLAIIEVPHVRRPDLFPAGATYESLGVELWDQGFAYVVRDGTAYRGFWRRNNRNPGQALQLIYGDNTPIKLKPGRTWIMVVRGLGQANFNEALIDVNATATITAQTPSPTPFDPNPDE